jgi:hypothetical protein
MILTDFSECDINVHSPEMTLWSGDLAVEVGAELWTAVLPEFQRVLIRPN